MTCGAQGNILSRSCKYVDKENGVMVIISKMIIIGLIYIVL